MKNISVLFLAIFSVWGSWGLADDSIADKLTVYTRQSALVEMLQCEEFRKHVQSDVILATLDLQSVQVEQVGMAPNIEFKFKFHYMGGEGSLDSCEFEATAKPTTKKVKPANISVTVLKMKFGRIGCVH